MSTESPKPHALLRGLRRRCPRCGEGRLFTGYLTRADACASCGESFVGLDADDGPAWLTVGVTAPLLIALMVALERGASLSTLAEGAVMVGAAVTIALLALPLAKGFFIAALWTLRKD